MIFSKHYQVTSDHHDLFTAVTDLGGDCKLDIYSSDVVLGMVRRQSLFLVFSLGTNVKPATRDHFYSICTSINATQDQGIAYYTIKRPHRKNIWQFAGMPFVLCSMDP